MKKILIAYLMLAASIVLADGRWIVIGVRNDASVSDGQAVKTKIQNVTGALIDNPVQWVQTNDVSKIWHLVCFDRTVVTNVTKAQVDAWRTANLDNPNLCRVETSDDPYSELVSKGLRPK